MNTDVNSLEIFCNRWLEKAKQYDTMNLADCFDKFTAIYVVYNRIYTEIGFLIRQQNASSITGRVMPTITPPKQPFRPLPDKGSATKYAVQYYGKSKLQQEISSDAHCCRAVGELVYCIRQGKFYFHENYDTGRPNTQKDLRLAADSEIYDPEAILSIIYQARCNIFHGQKEYISSQRELLICLSVLLEFITLKILERLLLDLRK